MDARAKISSVDRSKLIEVLVMEVENFWKY
jgi:hypothetical protein